MRQSGFTLIELLLVLAIIGIISAIAIPSLLSQRGRARDKAAITNTLGRIGDLVGQYDRAKEIWGNDPSAVAGSLRTYLQRTAIEKNPWNPAVTTMNPTPFQLSGNQTKSDFESNLFPSPYMGRGRVYVQFPSSAQPGYLGVVVQVRNPHEGTTLIRKSTGIE